MTLWLSLGNFLKNKFKSLIQIFTKALTSNKKIYINGFIYFRLSKYISILGDIVDEAVNSFIIEKEYKEFVSLLKVYINSQNSKTGIVHVIYSSNFTILLDDNKNLIENSNDLLNTKFLSDISFSTNDHTLNTLLELLPKKIFIHLIDNTIDEFIKTLSLIFEKRVLICTDCNICALYKKVVKSTEK